MGGDERSLGRKGTAGPDPTQDDGAGPASVTGRRRNRRTQAHTTGGRRGSWSSPPTPTTPSSARPGPRPAGSPTGPRAGSCAAPAATRVARTPTPTRSPCPRCARPSSGRRPRSSATPGSPSCTNPTARSRTTSALRELLVREIRTFRPDAVLATDPEALFYRDGGVNHTDHRAAGFAAVDAVYPAARNPMAFPWLAKGGLEAHRVRRLYLFWSNQPDGLGRRLGDDRAQARGARRPRQPDP